MLVVCATTVHRVGLQTAPNELCPRVPIMAWNTCAFTIQAIGTAGLCRHLCHSVVVLFFGSQRTPPCFHRKHFAGREQASLWVLTEQTGWAPPTDERTAVTLRILCKKLGAVTLSELVSLLQLAGLKAIVQFSATQRLMSFQAVIQRHFTDMLGGTWFILACLFHFRLLLSYSYKAHVLPNVLKKSFLSFALVITASPSPSPAAGHKQKEHAFSSGRRLLPSPGRFFFKSTTHKL